MICIMLTRSVQRQQKDCQIDQKRVEIKEEDTKMKDGIYRSDNATYYVLNEKILMRLMGEMYKTTKSFMQGDYIRELNSLTISEFDGVYNKVKNW